jgi:molybdopterin molybdotransferase
MPPPNSNPPPRDVRMRGFSRRSTVEDAWNWIDQQSIHVPAEALDTVSAGGRVLATDVTSPVNVPAFDRAMMDGFAVQADDTLGATPYNGLPLEVIGQALPAQPIGDIVKRGQAVRIMTGAPMPDGANAVLQVEQANISEDQVEALDAVTPGKHVGKVGEDIAQGSVVLRSGRRLRPQDIGILASIGVAKVSVFRRVRVRVLVTGNELLPPGSKPEGFQIVDSNSPMLRGLVGRDGGDVTCSEIVADDPREILAALKDDVDVILVSGGSSVGQEDYAPRLLAEHGELAIHGVAMRPSSPSGMGRLGERLVFLLPGNPVSCLCAYDFFAGRAIRALAGLPTEWPYRSRHLPLARKLVSMVGRVDYARVDVVDDRVEPMAVSGASMLSSTTRAAGFVIVPADSEGYAPETPVEVFFYDR